MKARSPSTFARVAGRARVELSRVARLPETVAVRALHLSNRYPPLFVTGAPRSGTTVVIQHLINSMRFGYFPNIARLHPNSCVFHTFVGKMFHRYEPSYVSRYGEMDGPMAPSDGWDIFHRWFPRYDYSVGVRTGTLHELRTIVRLFEMLFHAPFANKNNSNTVRIGELARLFPRAVFVHVTRDLVDTVVSVLRGRQQHGISEDEWWCAPPPWFWTRAFEDEFERVVCQVWGLDQFARESLSTLDADRYTIVAYDMFCSEPGNVLRWVEGRYRALDAPIGRRGGTAPASFGSSRYVGSDRPALEKRAREIIARLESQRAAGSGPDTGTGERR